MLPSLVTLTSPPSFAVPPLPPMPTAIETFVPSFVPFASCSSLERSVEFGTAGSDGGVLGFGLTILPGRKLLMLPTVSEEATPAPPVPPPPPTLCATMAGASSPTVNILPTLFTVTLPPLPPAPPWPPMLRASEMVLAVPSLTAVEVAEASPPLPPPPPTLCAKMPEDAAPPVTIKPALETLTAPPSPAEPPDPPNEKSRPIVDGPLPPGGLPPPPEPPPEPPPRPGPKSALAVLEALLPPLPPPPPML